MKRKLENGRAEITIKPEVIKLDQFWELYYDNYEKFKREVYPRELVEAFDNFISTFIGNCFICIMARDRMDLFTSDRECAAFMAALYEYDGPEVVEALKVYEIYCL